jgi:DnaJ domain
MPTTSTRQRHAAPLTITHLARCADGSSYELHWKCADKERFLAVVAAVRALPPSKRTYLPDRRLWVIHSVALLMGLDVAIPGLARAVEQLDHAERPGERTARNWHRPFQGAGLQPHIPPAVREALGVLYLAPGAPRELVQPCYRALAKLYHPDKGAGDHVRMCAVNKAYELVCDYYERYERTAEQRRGAA